MLTLYARKEPTLDEVLIDAVRRGQVDKRVRRWDVVLYRDRECKERYMYWTWHHSPPRRGAKMIRNLNSCNWAVEWLEDLPWPSDYYKLKTPRQ